MCIFAQSEIFQDKYVQAVLAEGLPDHFNTEEPVSGRPSTGRNSMTPTKDSRDRLIELQIFSNIKAFYSEKEINIQEVMDLLRQSKRNDDPKAYWQLFSLIFAAFFLDHTQNDFL